jgi:YggT family protein
VQLFLQTFVGMILVILWLLVLGRMLMSWVDPMGRTQIGGFLIQATEPLLAPVRRVMPPTGMFDFSSFIVLVVLGVLMRAVL